MVKFNKKELPPTGDKKTETEFQKDLFKEKQTPLDSELTLDAIDKEKSDIKAIKSKSNLEDLIGIIPVPIPIDAIQWLIHSVKRQYKNKPKSIAGWVMINQVSKWIESYNLSRQ